MKFDINDYKGKYAMHCKTKEEARDFCNYLHSIGKYWDSGGSYFNNTAFGLYKQDTAYNFNENSYCYTDYYANQGYTILEWSDFMNNKFTKADLKTGDVIRRRNGKIEIVILDFNMFLCENGGYNLLDRVNDNLTHMEDPEYDIVAVRRPCHCSDCCFWAFNQSYGELVYERKQPERMTLAEVCKLLGKEIEIVG